LRSIKTDYKFPLRYPDRITVLHKLLTEPKEGMDALHLEAVVLSETHQRIAARITEDIAVYDYRIGKKAPLPPFVIQSLRQIWQEQEKEVTRSMSEIFSLSGRISAVEKETWDRQDAVEDLGSAGASGNAMNTKQKKDADMLADLGVSVDPVDEKSGSGERDSDETPLEFEVMKKAG
jgi:predicted metal-dependent RNase